MCWSTLPYILPRISFVDLLRMNNMGGGNFIRACFILLVGFKNWPALNSVLMMKPFNTTWSRRPYGSTNYTKHSKNWLKSFNFSDCFPCNIGISDALHTPCMYIAQILRHISQFNIAVEWWDFCMSFLPSSFHSLYKNSLHYVILTTFFREGVEFLSIYLLLFLFIQGRKLGEIPINFCVIFALNSLHSLLLAYKKWVLNVLNTIYVFR